MRSQNQRHYGRENESTLREGRGARTNPSRQVKEGGVIVFPRLSRYTNSIKGALEAPAKISLVA